MDLAALQNLVKRDPEAYREEFELQRRHFDTQLQIFTLKPHADSDAFESLISFLSHVAPAYPQAMGKFPQELMDLLEQQAAALEPSLRLCIAKALILLRNRNLLTPTTLLPLFFKMFRTQDKQLRELVYEHIVHDIKRMNMKHKNNQLNRTLQNFMYTMLADTNESAAKRSLDVMIELYRKKIWDDAKTVNVISTACFSTCTKILVAALTFFIGEKDLGRKGDDESEEDSKPKMTMKDVQKKFNKMGSKKTRKKDKKLKAAIQKINKEKKAAAPKPNFPAIQLLHDPQAFCERLFGNLRKSTERFEVRLMQMNLISRLIAAHQLLVPNFYPFLLKYMQPHQQHITHILAYAAQACHELVDPETIEPLIRQLVNNFVVDRMSADAQAFGLNTVREMCLRCPLSMTETLLHDLAQYKTAREKGIRMASRSLIQLFRTVNPALLRKKDRGRDADVTKQPAAFGERKLVDHLEGIELLDEDDRRRAELGSDYEDDDGEGSGWDGWEEAGSDDEGEDEEDEEDEEEEGGEVVEGEAGDGEGEEEGEGEGEEGNDDEEGWQDVSHEEEDETNKKTKRKGEKEKEKAKVSDNAGWEGWEEASGDSSDEKGDGEAAQDEDDGEEEEEDESAKESASVRSTASSALSLASGMRILTDDDWERLRQLKARQASAGRKKQPVQDDSNSESDNPEGLVKEVHIVGARKKAKMDYEQRLERIKSGSEDRKDRGIRNRKNAMASKTNKEKEKNKPFKMAQRAPKVAIKKRRSLKEIRSRAKKNEKREIKFKIRRGY